MNKKTYLLEFTSIDCTINEIKKDFSLYLHAAGSSWMKGTESITKAWLNNSAMPQTTMLIRYPFKSTPQDNLHWITFRVPEDELNYLQNKCGIHLCPSETEGWGHYLVEAMSTGAVVITTDAPPMNEFITDRRCLVPYESTKEMSLATGYCVDPVALKDTVRNLMTLPAKELKAIGAQNRLRYLEKTQEFYENIEKLINDYLLNPESFASPKKSTTTTNLAKRKS